MTDRAADIDSTRGGCFRRVGVGGGFTLLEMLVSLLIVLLLVALMLPGLATVRASARQVACASNLRQLGLATQLYAGDSAELLPSTATVRLLYLVSAGHGEGGESRAIVPAVDADVLSSLVLRYEPGALSGQVSASGWDGWGLLYARHFVRGAELFYCPSHRAGVSAEANERSFGRERRRALGNYAFRGSGPDGAVRLSSIDASAVLGSDALGDLGWLNHEEGLNVMQASLAVRWVRGDVLPRPTHGVGAALSTPADGSAVGGSAKSVRSRLEEERRIWVHLDSGASGSGFEPASSGDGEDPHASGGAGDAGGLDF